MAADQLILSLILSLLRQEVTELYDTIVRGLAKLIGIYDPLRAARYLQQHNYLSQRGYLAAKKTQDDWRVTQSSGAQENVLAWQKVTNKTRDLARNNPYIVGARRRFRSNLISEGIWPRPKVMQRNAKSKFDLDKELNLDILQRWESFAPKASANGDSLYQLQRVAANHFFDDGQFLIRKIISKDGLKIQILECDHLDISRDKDASSGQNRIAGGIELDEFNKPLAYWVYPVHPSENTSVSIRIPATEMFHVFDRQRASDVTGICGYASVVQSVFRVNEYAYSTMDTARLSNHFGVWIESPYVDDYGQATKALETKTMPNGTVQRQQNINPAGFHYGLPGEIPHLMKPENPGSQYGPFITKELQTTSVGAGIGYEAVSHDGSQSNFSSSRALLLIERGYTKMNQAVFEEQFHAKIYEWFIEFELYLAKKPLRMPNYEIEKSRYLRKQLSRPIQEWVDPWKDTAARGERIRLRLSTETDEAEDSGKDIEEIYATLAYEKQLREKYGLPENTESLSAISEDVDPTTGNMPQ